MKTYLEPDDIELIEGAATCLRDRLLVRILFRLGCRVSEALALKVGDIDSERGTVTIQQRSCIWGPIKILARRVGSDKIG